MLTVCPGDKDVADRGGVVRALLAAAAALQSARRTLSRNQHVRFIYA